MKTNLITLIFLSLAAVSFAQDSVLYIRQDASKASDSLKNAIHKILDERPGEIKTMEQTIVFIDVEVIHSEVVTHKELGHYDFEKGAHPVSYKRVTYGPFKSTHTCLGAVIHPGKVATSAGCLYAKTSTTYIVPYTIIIKEAAANIRDYSGKSLGSYNLAPEYFDNPSGYLIFGNLSPHSLPLLRAATVKENSEAWDNLIFITLDGKKSYKKNKDVKKYKVLDSGRFTLENFRQQRTAGDLLLTIRGGEVFFIGINSKGKGNPLFDFGATAVSRPEIIPATFLGDGYDLYIIE